MEIPALLLQIKKVPVSIGNMFNFNVLVDQFFFSVFILLF